MCLEQKKTINLTIQVIVMFLCLECPVPMEKQCIMGGVVLALHGTACSDYVLTSRGHIWPAGQSSTPVLQIKLDGRTSEINPWIGYDLFKKHIPNVTPVHSNDIIQAHMI